MAEGGMTKPALHSRPSGTVPQIGTFSGSDAPGTATATSGSCVMNSLQTGRCKPAAVLRHSQQRQRRWPGKLLGWLSAGSSLGIAAVAMAISLDYTKRIQGQILSEILITRHLL